VTFTNYRSVIFVGEIQMAYISGVLHRIRSNRMKVSSAEGLRWAVRRSRGALMSARQASAAAAIERGQVLSVRVRNFMLKFMTQQPSHRNCA